MTVSSVSTPRMPHNTRARMARNTPETSESTAAACTFSASTPRLRLSSKRPVWMEVESLLPMAPKMAPRIPMAAGMSTASPTSSSRVPAMPASTMPAMSSPVEDRNSAANPCLRVSFSSVRYPYTLGLRRGLSRSLWRRPPSLPLGSFGGVSATQGGISGRELLVKRRPRRRPKPRRGLEHLLATQVKEHPAADQGAQGEHRVETEPQVRLGHEHEVHAVDARDKRQRQKDQRDRREPLHALVDALGLLGCVDVQRASEVVAHGVDHVYDPEQVVAHVVVVGPALLGDQTGRRPHEHADDVPQGHRQAPQGRQLVLEVKKGFEDMIRGLLALAEE